MLPEPVETYYDYVITSPRWRKLRQRLLRTRGRRCQHCGVDQAKRYLQLHHVSYDRLGFERDEDLLVLCRSCHQRADRARELAALDQARFEGWAAKVYGERWSWEYDPRDVEAAYDEWCERRGDSND
jgi:5-methylcytosine-specific restriction endonuclease McrA